MYQYTYTSQTKQYSVTTVIITFTPGECEAIGLVVPSNIVYLLIHYYFLCKHFLISLVLGCIVIIITRTGSYKTKYLHQ